MTIDELLLKTGQVIREEWYKTLVDILKKHEADIERSVTLLIIQKHLGVFWFNNHWYPPDMLPSLVTGTGGIEWLSYRVRPYTGTDVDSYAHIYKLAYGLSGAASWDKKRHFGVFVRFETISAQNIHIVTGGAPTTGPSNTFHHIGFKLINADLYGTVGDGVAESTLLLETLTGPVYRRLECVLDPEVPECRFFLDGVDKGAITANLPTGIDYATTMLRANVHNTEAVNKFFDLLESRTLQEE